jgi:hypothetical protein
LPNDQNILRKIFLPRREGGCEKIKKPTKTEQGPQGWFSWRTLERNPLAITFAGLIVVSSRVYSCEWVRTYDDTHSKVQKESHPERAEDFSTASGGGEKWFIQKQLV